MKRGANGPMAPSRLNTGLSVVHTLCMSSVNSERIQTDRSSAALVNAKNFLFWVQTVCKGYQQNLKTSS